MSLLQTITKRQRRTSDPRGHPVTPSGNLPGDDTQGFRHSPPSGLPKLGDLGQGDDTLVAHISPEEARLLSQRGGIGTRNPDTGLLQFFGDYGGWSWEGGEATGEGGYGGHGGTGDDADIQDELSGLPGLPGFSTPLAPEPTEPTDPAQTFTTPLWHNQAELNTINTAPIYGISPDILSAFARSNESGALPPGANVEIGLGGDEITFTDPNIPGGRSTFSASPPDLFSMPGSVPEGILRGAMGLMAPGVGALASLLPADPDPLESFLFSRDAAIDAEQDAQLAGEGEQTPGVATGLPRGPSPSVAPEAIPPEFLAQPHFDTVLAQVLGRTPNPGIEQERFEDIINRGLQGVFDRETDGIPESVGSLEDLLSFFNPGTGAQLLGEESGRLRDQFRGDVSTAFDDFQPFRDFAASPEAGSLADRITQDQQTAAFNELSNQINRGTLSARGEQLANLNIGQQFEPARERVGQTLSDVAEERRLGLTDLRDEALGNISQFQLGRPERTLSERLAERDAFTETSLSNFDQDVRSGLGLEPLFDRQGAFEVGASGQGLVSGGPQDASLDVIAAGERDIPGRRTTTRGLGRSGSGSF